MGDGSIETVDPYFLGSIVLVKALNSPNAQIVDGKQRLITPTIMLSALRACVPTDFVDGISNRIYEKEDRAAGLPARYRLTPKPQDAEFFREHIQISGRI
jgi:hypothetical protein